MCPDGNPTFIDKSAGGWTNILSHAHTKRGHSRSWTEFALDELKIKLAQQGGEMGPLDKHVIKSSPEAQKLFGWMEQVIMADLPQSWVENQYARKYTNLDVTDRKTFAKYMDLLKDEVQEKIAQELPETFGLVFDGWSFDGDHFICIFAICL